jgi:CRP-like cAMP-binding protein
MASMAAKESIDLSHIWLLSSLSKAERKALEQKARKMEVPAGTLVLDEGSVGQACYVIETGKVAILRHNRKIAEVGEGQIVGEVALLDRLPRTASVKTLADSVLYEFTKADFDAVLDGSPATTRKLLTTLAARLRDADARAAY